MIRRKGIQLDFLPILTSLAQYKLSRKSSSEIQIGKIDDERNFVIVNNKTVSIDSAIVVDLTENLINANGEDSGTTPSADGFYYVYLSNSLVSWASNSLKLSSVSPTCQGYLGAYGYARNWKKMGVAKLDSGAVSLSNDWQICGKGIDFFDKPTTSEIMRNSGSLGYYQDSQLQVDNFAVMENTYILISATIKGYWEVSSRLTQSSIYLDSNPLDLTCTDVANSGYRASAPTFAGYFFNSDGYHLIEQRYYYDGSGYKFYIWKGDVNKETHIKIYRFAI